MKQIFIVLLIAAVGVGVYFYFFNKKQNTSSSNSNELIVGKWKVDSLEMKPSDSSEKQSGWVTGIHNFVDSIMRNSEFEFRKDSVVLTTFEGKIQDTSHYEFSDNNLLFWNRGDSSKTKWNIRKLDSTSLIVNDPDSSVFYFRKIN